MVDVFGHNIVTQYLCIAGVGGCFGRNVERGAGKQIFFYGDIERDVQARLTAYADGQAA